MNTKTKLKWWQVALLSIVVSAIGGLSAGRSKKPGWKIYTQQLKQAPWAPPAWVFAPAWTINNFFILKALQRLLHSDIPEKRKLLVLQAMIWIVFFSFNYIYFNKKSPALAAIWTMSDTVFAVASFMMAFKADKKLSYNYLPLVTGTIFASTIGNYQALKNPDPVLHTPALLN